MSKIKIGLFGFGVVGQGIYQVVQKSKNAHAEIVKICVRDPEKPRKVEVDKSLFTTSADEILDNRDINLIGPCCAASRSSRATRPCWRTTFRN